MKQLSTDFTWLAEASYQHFFPHTYPFTRYQFGGETRLNTAAVYRVHGAGRFRLDLAGGAERAPPPARPGAERRGRDGAARRPPAARSSTRAPALRAYLRTASRSALGAKRAALTSLNEEADQQGSEGLERFRAAFTVSYSTGL